MAAIPTQAQAGKLMTFSLIPYVINPMVQEENRQTEKQAKNGHTTKQYAYLHDVRFAQSLSNEEAKHSVHEIEQTP
jgi:hypothetical protein